MGPRLLPSAAGRRKGHGVDKVRIGIAGLGRFGRLHAATLAGIPGVEIAGVCDPDETARSVVAGRHPGARAYASLDEMLDAGGLDAVFLVTPEQLHGEQALNVLGRGLPLFLEKPMGATLEEATLVRDAAAAAGVPLQLGFVLRFDTQHAMLQAEIAAGRFGDLVSLRVKRNCSRAWFGDYGDRVHPVYETSIHDLDLLLWLTGSACTSVYAVQRNYAGFAYPDGCWALLEFASGAVAQVETSWFIPEGAPANVLTPNWHGTIDSELEVVGTERTARLRLLDSGLAIWRQDVTAHPETGLWPDVSGAIGGALREQDRHFVERVRQGAASAIASVDDALEGIRIADAIVASAGGAGRIALA